MGVTAPIAIDVSLDDGSLLLKTLKGTHHLPRATEIETLDQSLNDLVVDIQIIVVLALLHFSLRNSNDIIQLKEEVHIAVIWIEVITLIYI